jgi:hypothetical protein
MARVLQQGTAAARRAAKELVLRPQRQGDGAAEAPPNARSHQEKAMLKFLGTTVGVIFAIGLIVVVLVLMLIF